MASAREPVVLAPVKPWNLQHGNDSCQLFRTFGNPASPTSFVLERIAPDAPFTMMVYGSALNCKPDGRQATATLVGSAGPSFDEGEITETTKGKLTAIHWSGIGLLPEEPAEERRLRNERAISPS
jgi:hypothetical protein